jgi:hypothetical protein
VERSSEKILQSSHIKIVSFPTSLNQEKIEKVDDLMTLKDATNMREAILQRTMSNITPRYSNSKKDASTYSLPLNLQR